MSHDHRGIDRRKLLQSAFAVGANSALGGLPVIALCEAIVNGFIQKAAAEAANVSALPRNYINVLYGGAPCRYAFDGWVRVNDTDAAIQANPMVSTRLASSGGVYNAPMYETFGVAGPAATNVLVPVFFRNSITTSKGNLPLTSLLKNMMVVRGYGTGIDGHPANAAAQLTPLAGSASITGAVADSSSLAFSAVQYPNRGGYTQFTSEKGKGLLAISDANPLAKLMEAFAAPSAMQGRNLQTNVQTVIDAYSERLKAIADSGTPEAKAVGLNFRNAQAMMKKGVSDINAYWGPAVARYKSLIYGAINSKGLYGLSDMPVMNSANNDMVRMYDNTAATSYRVSTDYNLVDGIGNMAVNSPMAEGFALAEYMITKGLGSALELNIGDLYNMGTKLQMNGANNAISNAYMPNDMHEMGAVTMTLYTTAHFRGFSAAVMELSGQLSQVATASGGNMWQDTVIQLCGDFSRIARSSGTGSDHGFNQMVTSVYSGAIDQGPFVVGNVRAGGFNGDYNGSQGVGAEISGYNQRNMPTPMMMASTVAELLRLEKNPYSNTASPLITMKNDRVTYSTFGQGKTV